LVLVIAEQSYALGPYNFEFMTDVHREIMSLYRVEGIFSNRWSDILFADRQARRGLVLPWAAGKNGKEYRATLGHKPVGGVLSVGVEEKHRW
jgi:hypothetical protein